MIKHGNAIGSKKDIWIGINPITGEKTETLSDSSADRVCPVNSEKSVFIGRTEYHLSMFDEANRSRRWNATFTDYSSHVLPGTTTTPRFF
jgi:serine/threonine-protein kinase/endoribonuclease IRE1